MLEERIKVVMARDLAVTEDEEPRKDITCSFPLVLLDKLEELARTKYRGANRSQALRWIVEDAYEAWDNEVKVIRK